MKITVRAFLSTKGNMNVDGRHIAKLHKCRVAFFAQKMTIKLGGG